MPDQRIKHTSNYALFSRGPENRSLDLKKHKSLRVSMQRYGFLPEFPIIVFLDARGNMIVKDGQHRLAIAEELGLPVYFVVASNDFDIAVVNNGQKPWVLANYVERYAEQGKEDYEEVRDFANNYKLPLGTAFGLLAGTASWHNMSTQIYDGSYKIKDREWANNVAAVFAPFSAASKNVKNARFIEACMAVCRVKGFDRERLLAGLARCRDKLQSYSTREAYLDVLEEIYNFGRKGLVPLKINAINAMKERNAALAAQQKKQAQKALSA